MVICYRRLSFGLMLVCLALISCTSVRAQASNVPASQPLSWKRLVRNVAQDQKGLWTSPFRASRRDARWWGLLGSGTGVLIATDKWTSRQLPNTPDQVRVSLIASRFGAAYTLAPAAVAMYFAGSIRRDGRLRECGLLTAEALADSLLVSGALKVATQRQRPLEGDSTGRFFRGSGRLWNLGSSFPSGHAMQVWAVAAIVAREYPRPRFVPIATYSAAAAVMASRFTGRQHFASDVVAGAALGWYLGNYVYRRRHAATAGGQPSRLSRALSRLILASP